MKRLTWLWPTMLAMAVGCFVLASCAYSRMTPQGELEIVGKDIVPGVLPADGVVRDVIGSVVDAAGKVDPDSVIDAVTGHDWLGLALTLVGVLGAAGGGFILRRKIRAKKAGVQ